jgi:hypothetical protein
MLYKHLATIFNQMFTKHEQIEEIGMSILITLNKMNGKPPEVTNSRPITLLNMIRKILSNIVLARIQDVIFKFVSPAQSAFRPKRSTADCVWSYRWLMAMTQKYTTELYIMGIDLSKAFDCINRAKLMEIMEDLLKEKESELRIVRYLLANTNLTARVQGIKGDTFNTTLGIPQGDGLSPALFIIYLQAAINYYVELQHREDPSPGNIINKIDISNYADDTDFLSGSYGANFSTSLQLPPILAEFNLQMNAGKTEWVTINRNSCDKLTNKKLGTILSQKEDIKYRITKARNAFRTMYKIWLNKGPIKLSTKMFLYDMFVKPVMTYNTSCLGVSETQLKHMDSTHRYQLRSLSGIRYPVTITNTRLYKHCKTQPVHLFIIRQRWKLFGHILRLDNNVPAHRAMFTYFNNPDNFNLYKGRSPTNLPTQLDSDLRTIGKRLRTF